MKEKINPDNLIYKYKTEGRSGKDFSNYQNPIYLFINLRDGNENPREILKNQIDVKSDLGKNKNKKKNKKNNNNKKNPKWKSKDQINVIQNVQNFFDLREKIIFLCYI